MPTIGCDYKLRLAAPQQMWTSGSPPLVSAEAGEVAHPPATAHRMRTGGHLHLRAVNGDEVAQ